MKTPRPEQGKLFERTPDEREHGLQQIAEIRSNLERIYNDRRDEGRRT